MEIIGIDEAIRRGGLRLVLVHMTPSPWGQAAKAMMEYKGLPFACAYQEPGGENAELVAWAGINSAPVVAWNDEKPIHHWADILFLLERLAPQRPLLPEDAATRARVLGLSHLLCGELGLGWNRRLSLFRSPMESGQPPPPVLAMARKYRYNEADVALAARRQVETLQLLAAELDSQRAGGSEWFTPAGPTALDFYWASFCNLFALLPPEQCPMPDGFRQMFGFMEPEVAAALTPALVEHRDRTMARHFKLPMEF